MSDITINNDENQNKKRKMTPIAESFILAESQKLGLPTTVLQIWQGRTGSNCDRRFWRPLY